MFWVSEQRLVGQANTIYRNSWMTGLEIEELERKLAKNDSLKKTVIQRLINFYVGAAVVTNRLRIKINKAP